MSAELTSDAKLAINEYVQSLSKDEADRWSKLVGVSVLSLLSALAGAYATIRGAAESAAKLEAREQAEKSIKDLTSKASDYDKTMAALSAAASDRIAAAISSATMAQKDAEQLKAQQQSVVANAGAVAKTLEDLKAQTQRTLDDVAAQKDRAAKVAESLKAIEEQVGGDVAGKAALINGLLASVKAQDIGMQMAEISAAVEAVKHQNIPLGSIVAIGRQWTDQDEALTGWYRCDGRVVDDIQLPDMGDRFLKGLRRGDAGSQYPPEQALQTGGDNRDSHTHTGRTLRAGESPHMSAKGGFDSGNRVAAQDITQTVEIGQNTTSGNPYSNAPAYTAVQFIMRVR